MEHVGIDLALKESQICVRGSDGQILEEKRLRTGLLGKYLRGRPASRVIVETCAEAFGIADQALELGHEVRVVPAFLVRSLGVGARGIKNDRSDARALSEVSCRIDLPSVHVPTQQARQRKSLCGSRDVLVQSRTKHVNNVRGWLRATALSPKRGTVETFPARVGDLKVEVPRFVQRLLTSIEQLTALIREADAELEKLAKGDATCLRLMTVPGVGPVTAVCFAATLDDASRFGGAAQVRSYLGLVPGEHSSGERKRMTSITKAGSARVRWALVQAAWVVRRCRPHDPMALWAAEIERRRGKRIAVIALARKLAGMLFAIWRDGSSYNAAKAAAAKPPLEVNPLVEAQEQALLGMALKEALTQRAT